MIKPAKGYILAKFVEETKGGIILKDEQKKYGKFVVEDSDCREADYTKGTELILMEGTPKISYKDYKDLVLIAETSIIGYIGEEKNNAYL